MCVRVCVCVYTNVCVFLFVCACVFVLARLHRRVCVCVCLCERVDVMCCCARCADQLGALSANRFHVAPFSSQTDTLLKRTGGGV